METVQDGGHLPAQAALNHTLLGLSTPVTLPAGPWAWPAPCLKGLVSGVTWPQNPVQSLKDLVT